MGEAVAAAATIVQLVGFGLSTAEKLISFAEKFSSHSQQIQRLATHVKRNARALAKLERSLTEDEKAGAHINDDFKEDIYSTVESCRDILVRLGDAIDISPSTAGDEKVSASASFTRAVPKTSPDPLYEFATSNALFFKIDR